jgi:PAS domain-containing protein
MSFLYDYRGFVLFFIIMIETLFTITIFDKVAAASLTMRLLESITDMLGIMFTIYLFYHTLVLERKIVQRKNIEEKTKIAKVEYDLTEATWNINKEFMACFDVEEAEKSTLLSLFADNKSWQDLISNSDKEYEAINYTGVVKHKDKYYRFFSEKIASSNDKVNTVVIHFIDSTTEIIEQEEMVELYKKYRTRNYELDALLNNLPLPIWKKFEDGSMSFYNDAYEKFMLNVSQNFSNPQEVNNTFCALFKECISQNRPVSILKHYIINNKIEAFKFVEIPMKYNLGSVGYAEDIHEVEELQNNFKSLLSTSEKMMELSSSGILIIDSNKKVISFNQAFSNIFNIDPKWLKQYPNFTLVLDRLRENKKLPEVRDYKDYKSNQIKILNELIDPYYDLLHLSNGQTLRLSLLPTRSGNTIMIYDDITEILKIERSYNELSNVYHSVVYNLSEGVVILGANGKVKLFNKKAIALLKLELEFMKKLPHFNDILKTLNSPKTSILNQKIISCLEFKKHEDCKVKLADHTLSITLKSLPDYSVQMNISS